MRRRDVVDIPTNARRTKKKALNIHTRTCPVGHRISREIAGKSFAKSPWRSTNVASRWHLMRTPTPLPTPQPRTRRLLPLLRRRSLFPTRTHTPILRPQPRTRRLLRLLQRTRLALSGPDLLRSLQSLVSSPPLPLKMPPTPPYHGLMPSPLHRRLPPIRLRRSPSIARRTIPCVPSFSRCRPACLPCAQIRRTFSTAWSTSGRRWRR